MKRVVATGTFDILHPGHIYYLEQSRKLGDELTVIVARDANVRHKPRPIISEDQRLRIMQSLRVADHVVLGDKTDMFRPVEEIRPAVITFGFNQHFDEQKIRGALEERGMAGIDLVRIGPSDEYPLCSSRRIIREILARHSCEERNE
jgi:FAD synthetase